MSGVGPLMPDIAWASLHANGFVLELGSFTGEGSTRAIQSGLAYWIKGEPLHITVDWEDNLTVHRPHVSWWHFVLGDTREPATVEKVRSICGNRAPGLIFIDTDHNYDQMRAELKAWDSIADKNTVWLFHDTWMYGTPNAEMVRAIAEFADANGWRYEDYRQDSHGLGRMTR